VAIGQDLGRRKEVLNGDTRPSTPSILDKEGKKNERGGRRGFDRDVRAPVGALKKGKKKKRRKRGGSGGDGIQPFPFSKREKKKGGKKE